MRLVLWVMGAVCAAGAATAGVVAPGAAIDRHELQAFVDGAVGDAMASDHIAGVAVAVVQAGRPVVLRGYGFAGFSPLQPVDAERTLFRIGSVSKTFIWIALMQQVEQRRMRLEDPVNDHLPDGLQIPAQGFERPIRLVDLMAHAAGFEDRDMGSSFLRDPAGLLPLAEFLAANRPDRIREPGPPSTYSNHGAALAAAAVAHVEREDFATLVERGITGPLRMNSTTFRQPHAAGGGLPAPMPRELAARLSTGFRWTGTGFQPREFEYIARPSGMASATAADMARYMLMQLNDGALDGATVYGAAAAAAFRTPLLDMPDDMNGWAHGFSVQTLPGGFKGYGHGGGTLSFFTNMVVVPSLDLGIFVVTNTDTAQPFVVRFPQEIVDRFYNAGRPAWRGGDPELVKRASLYEGHYLSTRRAYSGLREFWGRILEAAEVAVTRDGYLVTRSGSAGQRWVPSAIRGQFRAVDRPETLLFELDAHGRALRWIGPGGSRVFERINALQTPRALGILAGCVVVTALGSGLLAFNRFRRRPRSPRRVAALEIVTLAASGAWLVSILAFNAWRARAGDPVNWYFDFPGSLLLAASVAALVATAGSIAILAGVISSIRTRREPGAGAMVLVDGAVYCAAALIYLFFAAVLASWGALSPWA